MRLYRVLLKGMQHEPTGTKYGCPFVVAENPAEALEKVQKYLDEKKLGFPFEREMDKIELLAEVGNYPNCKVQLFL